MLWEIAVTLAAVGLLALLHFGFAVAGDEEGRLSAIARDLAGGRDPWARLLVVAAVATTLFALGVVVVPALFDSDEESAPTRPTATTPTTQSSSTTSTSTSTATAPTTTLPTTTVPIGPPPGTVLIAQTAVRGSTGQVLQSSNRAGGPLVVRQVRVGVYRVIVPGLTADARDRATVRAVGLPGIDVRVRKASGSPAFVVFTRSGRGGKPVAADFRLVVYGPSRDAHPQKPHKPVLPKTL
jgi:hypothetical protein